LSSGGLEASDVIAFAKKNLAGYKVPKRVVITPELPRLGSGKPDRRALLARAAAELELAKT
jgi:acyl-CoA synthetase (AMP-forming)/AMP-acid ligase II